MRKPLSEKQIRREAARLRRHRDKIRRDAARVSHYEDEIRRGVDRLRRQALRVRPVRALLEHVDSPRGSVQRSRSPG